MERLLIKRQEHIYFLIAAIFYLLLYDLLASFKMWGIVKIGVILYYSLFFAVYPLFYLHIRMLISSESGGTKYSYKYHLIIPLIAFVFTTIFYLLLAESERWQFYSVSYIFKTDNELINLYHIVLYILYYAQFIIYLVLMVRLAEKSKSLFKEKYFYAKWVYAFAGAAVLYESILIGSAFVLSGNDLLMIEQVFSFFFVLFAGFIGFNHWLIQLRLNIEKMDFLNNAGQVKAISIRLSVKEQNEIREEIERFIRFKKVFIDPNIKIETFAKRIHIPAKKLSNVINQLYGMNFNTFINSLRVEEAKEFMINSTSELNYEDIFLKVGFLSRSTFNRAFKTHTGLTPSEYQLNYNKIT